MCLAGGSAACPGMGMLFGLCAGLLMLVGFLIYYRQLARGSARPDPASWLMWTTGATSLCLVLSQRGIAASVLIPLAVVAIGGMIVIAAGGAQGMAALSGSLIILAFNGAIQSWNLLLLVGPVRHLGFDPETAMILVALSMLGAVSASWPTLCATSTQPRREHPAVWFIWSGAYGAMALTIMAEGLGWHYLIHPLTMQGIHVMLGAFALGQPEALTEKPSGQSFR